MSNAGSKSGRAAATDQAANPLIEPSLLDRGSAISKSNGKLECLVPVLEPVGGPSSTDGISLAYYLVPHLIQSGYNLVVLRSTLFSRS